MTGKNTDDNMVVRALRYGGGGAIWIVMAVLAFICAALGQRIGAWAWVVGVLVIGAVWGLWDHYVLHK